MDALSGLSGKVAHVLCLVGGRDEGIFLARVAEYLRRVHPIVLTGNIDSAVAGMRRKGWNCIPLSELLHLDHFASMSRGDAIAEAARILPVDIGTVLHMDPMLYLYVDRDVAVDYLARITIASERYFRSQRVVAFIHYSGAGEERAMTLVAQSLGIPAYSLTQCVGNRELIDNCGLRPAGVGEQFTWKGFNQEWSRWRRRRIKKHHIERAKSYVASYVEFHKSRKRTKSPTMHHDDKSDSGLASTVFPPPRGDRVKYIDHNRLLAQWQEDTNRAGVCWQKHKDSFVYDSIPDRDFIYFPLCLPFDMPHRSWNPMNHYYDHHSRIIFDSLPYGCDLVIKEHPYSSIDISQRFLSLRELQRIGIKVVHPETHGLELIRRSALVVSIGETSGWEAIMLRRPLVIFDARPFYAAYPLAKSVFSANELSSVIRAAMATNVSATAHLKTWCAFLLAALDSGRPGNVWAYKANLWSDRDSTNRNMENVGEMLIERLGLKWRARMIRLLRAVAAKYLIRRL